MSDLETRPCRTCGCFFKYQTTKACEVRRAACGERRYEDDDCWIPDGMFATWDEQELEKFSEVLT